MRHIASSGLWVILAAKARYAAGEAWPRVPDVFHDERLAERYRAMWAHLATALAGEEGLAGYEVMSEPRNKHVAQSEVVRLYEDLGWDYLLTAREQVAAGGRRARSGSLSSRKVR